MNSALSTRAFLICAAASLLCASIASAQPVTIDRSELKQMIRELIREELNAERSKVEVTTPTRQPAPSNKGQADDSALTKTIADEVGDQIAAVDTVPSSRSIKAGAFDLSFGGYGDIQYAHHDYTENGLPQEGSRGASRAEFDLTRFTFEVEGEHRESGIEFEAEVEYEHGGTGAGSELDYEEFGEFETEVEKGGEVVVEELFAKKEFGDGWSGRAGRFYVNVGLLSDYHLPTDYLGTSRPEVETTIIPGVWDEIGIEAQKQFENGRVALQIVNGLDSTGFSAARWVSGGKQDRFETTRAQDLAAVLRLDGNPSPGLLVGGSVYYGGSTTENRPKADLEDADGSVLIGDLHARYWGSRLRTQGALVWGHLGDAGPISERNSSLSNTLGVARTAVADEALGVWTELGYNVAPTLAMGEVHRLDPFLRFEYYDTYYDTRADLADNDRYERTIYTSGLAYTYDTFLTTKLDYSIRDYGQNGLTTQNTLRLELGFVY